MLLFDGNLSQNSIRTLAWPSQHKYPASRRLNLSAPGTGFNMDKGWCYEASADVYLLVSMEKCKSYITSELLKLHLLAGEGENPEHTATPFIAQMAGKTCTFHVRYGNNEE
uniref:Uncharacterized protein n=1 Tax=Brassica oleracea TaxID=3712 RepID=A0A3P6G1P0_BRAOL|nr:unnamed protein product [Brassica oleracea]